jgi:hypothetical protein
VAAAATPAAATIVTHQYSLQTLPGSHSVLHSLVMQQQQHQPGSSKQYALCVVCLVDNPTYQCLDGVTIILSGSRKKTVHLLLRVLLQLAANDDHKDSLAVPMTRSVMCSCYPTSQHLPPCQ